MRQSPLLTALLCTLLIISAGFSIPLPVSAQQATKQWAETEQTRRIALVIGNAEYQYGSKLKNPVNDADAMAALLRKLGFEVILLENATNRQMVDAINTFGDKLTDNCIALAYYSGHGIQSDGQNYLLPVDFNAKKRADVEFEAVPIARLLRQFEERRSPVNIVILDACRNNPFRSFARSGEVGLSRPELTPRGTLLAYATGPGSVADDNTEGQNGLYTTELLKHLADPGVNVREVFDRVREGVATASGEKQIPWEEVSLRGNLCLVKGSPVAATPAAEAKLPATPSTGRVVKTKATLQVTVNCDQPTIKVDGVILDGNEYITNLTTEPKRTVAVLVTAPGYEDQLIEGVELVRGAVTPLKVELVALPAPKVSATAPRTLADYKAQIVTIPGGSFTMGSNEAYENEKPVHRVTLSGFRMGRTLVTVAMWREYCRENSQEMPRPPDWGWIDDHPIVNVRWEDVRAYCTWATRKLGLTVSLPTEAQWEYAAKGGKETRYPWGNDLDESKMVCDKNAQGRTAPVDRTDRVYVNGYGLVDMAGNVWQFCADWYGPYNSAPVTDPTGPPSGEFCVVRGGSWLQSLPSNHRCADRGKLSPRFASPIRGFRLVLPAP